MADVDCVKPNKMKRFDSTELTNRGFHPCHKEVDCLACRSNEVRPWSHFNQAYCICLTSRPDRYQHSSKEFHRLGLCVQMEYFRPIKPESEKVTQMGFDRVQAVASWQSHREVAIRALENPLNFETSEDKLGCVLIFEDDVQFTRNFNLDMLEKIKQQIRRLPPDWDIFYLGYFPVPIPGTNYPLSMKDWSVW